MTTEKLTRFYRISTWFILILLSSNILVKATIWFSALPEGEQKDKVEYPIYFFKTTIYFRNYSYRYTTELKQEVFNKVDFLLPPGFLMLFVLIAVRAVKIPEIFREQKE